MTNFKKVNAQLMLFELFKTKIEIMLFCIWISFKITVNKQNVNTLFPREDN